MFDDAKGPITHFEWGKYIIQGQVHSDDGAGVGKDIFLSPDGILPWKARKGHTLKPKMVACAVPLKLDVLVIGCGVNGAIKVQKKTRKTIEEAGIPELILARTPKACEKYNQLFRQGKKVALLAHGTC